MPDAPSVQLVARAEAPSTEILVLDARFQFVGRGVGTLDTPLAPGVYTVQYKAGSAVVEVPVILRPGAGVVTIDAPPLTLRSPAPLTGNDAGARYGQLARDTSREIHDRRGSGGQLFIFIRPAGQDATRPASADSLSDVSVLDAETNVVVELARSGKRGPDGIALGVNLELAAGTYLLRFRAGAAEWLEQAVAVCEGWQTQVFASSRPFGDTAGWLGPNFPEAAVFMARQGLGFDPNGRAAMRAEAARQGLEESRPVAPEGRLREAVTEAQDIRRMPITDGEIRDMLQQKFGNPMLGIYGIHLMLLSPERPWDLLRDVVTTLKSLIGEHPDVLALTMLPELRDLGEGVRYEIPPMLRNSWKLVVDGSAGRPELVPAGSYASSIARRTWGSNAWLTWRPPGAQAAARHAEGRPEKDATPTEVGVAIVRVQQHILQNLRRLGARPYIQQVASDQRLTDTERAILLHSITIADQGTRMLAEIRSHSTWLDRLVGFGLDKLKQYQWTDRLTGGLKLAPAILAHYATDRMVRTLSVPRAALNQAIVSLADKVDQNSP